MKFLNRLSIGFFEFFNSNNLIEFSFQSPINALINRLRFSQVIILHLTLLGAILPNVLSFGQATNLVTNAGTSYPTTKGVKTNPYGPATITNCTSVDFSVSFNFSLDWPGTGNMDSASDCGCAGDPLNPAAGSCDDCWDFLWVRFLVNGVEVGGDLIGAGNNVKSSTISLSGVPVSPGDIVEIEVNAQTWASNESVTTSNIFIRGNAGPVPLTQIGPFCSNRGNVALSTQNATPGTWSGPGVGGTNFNPMTAGAGTHTITFTPAANRCATPTTMDIQVDQAGPAVLDDFGPYCVNSPTVN